MLTAPPNESNQISDLILLAVELAKEDARHPFVKFLNKVLGQAKKILADPKNFPTNRMPQAENFAFYLHLHPEMRGFLSSVETFKYVSENQVKEIMDQMGNMGMCRQAKIEENHVKFRLEELVIKSLNL